jgi:hypothetical protein
MSSQNLQQQQPQQPAGPPGLNTGAGVFSPRGPGAPLPVDTIGQLTQAMVEGGELMGRYAFRFKVGLTTSNLLAFSVFITTRGEKISHPHGRRPQYGHMGPVPYPRLDEVSEQ